MFRKMIYVILMMLLPFIGWGWEGNDNIMMWQVNDSANVDGSPSVYTYLQANYSDDEFGVRIACYSSDGTFIRYLNPIWEDDNHVKHIETEFNDQYVGTRDDFWYTQTSQAYYGPDDYYEKLFQMQIGNYDGNDDFIPILYSSKQQVDGKYWYDTGTLGPPNLDWTPTDFYTINPPISPEPSTGLLFIVGLSTIFMTRRKRTLL